MVLEPREIHDLTQEADRIENQEDDFLNRHEGVGDPCLSREGVMDFEPGHRQNRHDNSPRRIR